MNFIIVCLSLALLVLSRGTKALTEVDLHRKLFEFYNPDVLPVLNKSDPIEVAVDLYIWNIDTIDEKSQAFTIRAFLENRWTNSFLTWNHTKYGVKTINVRNENIWLPDLALENVYDTPTELGQRDGRSTVDYNGLCKTWPYKMFRVGCKITIRKYPFDVQSCTLDFLSWTNPNSVLRLKAPEKLSFSYYRESVEWSIESYNITYYQNPYGDDVWDHILFHFTLRRKWLFQVINMIAPLLCISILTPMCFIVPADSGEKITLSLDIFLTLAVFLTLISDSLPESSDETSLFSIYVGLQLACSALTIIGTVVSLNLYFRDKLEPVPFYYRLLSRLFCTTPVTNHYRRNTHVSSNGLSVTTEQLKTSSTLRCYADSKLSWVSVSKAFDRMCFTFLVIWNVGLAIGLVCAFQE